MGLMLSTTGVILKSAREITLMRRAGDVVYSVLSRVRELARPGVTTADLNEVAEDMIAAAGGTALFKGVENPHARFPFPAALCTSVNEQVVHGVPGEVALREGDIVSVDCGVRLAGYCGDSATTIAVGELSAETKGLLEITELALNAAVESIRPRRMWSVVASEMQRIVESAGFSVVRDFVGHGIGRDMHEEPKVPNYWDSGQKQMDFELVEHMVLAVEPMVNVGTHEVEYGDVDRWVVVTRDRKCSAHFEHSIAVTKNGADVLTNGR